MGATRDLSTVGGTQAAVMIALLCACELHEAGAQPLAEVCARPSVQIFAGSMPLPMGYQLQLEFEGGIRLIKSERRPITSGQHGVIRIGRVADLPSIQARDAEAKRAGGSIERHRRGRLQIETRVTRTEQTLTDINRTRLVALIFDEEHYMHIVDTDPDLWKRMLDDYERCSAPRD